MPDMWMRVPFIALSNPELAAYYDLTDGECAYIQAFDSNGNYKLQEKLEEAYNKMPAQRTRFDRDLMKLDEQLNIFHQLINHQMLNLFSERSTIRIINGMHPATTSLPFTGKDSMFVSRIFDWYLGEVQEGLKSGDWAKADEVVGMIDTYQQAKNKTLDISPKRMQAELKYNKMDVFRYCKIGYLVLGGLLLDPFLFAMLFRRTRWMKVAVWLLEPARTGRLPLSYVRNGGCAGISVAMLPGAIPTRRWSMWDGRPSLPDCCSCAVVRSPSALATLFGGIILFVSGLNWMDPEINPLVPVLKSPWLMFHVAVIVAAYGFFGISLPDRADQYGDDVRRRKEEQKRY